MTQLGHGSPRNYPTRTQIRNMAMELMQKYFPCSEKAAKEAYEFWRKDRYPSLYQWNRLAKHVLLKLDDAHRDPYAG